MSVEGSAGFTLQRYGDHTPVINIARATISRLNQVNPLDSGIIAGMEDEFMFGLNVLEQLRHENMALRTLLTIPVKVHIDLAARRLRKELKFIAKAYGRATSKEEGQKNLLEYIKACRMDILMIYHGNLSSTQDVVGLNSIKATVNSHLLQTYPFLPDFAEEIEKVKSGSPISAFAIRKKLQQEKAKMQKELWAVYAGGTTSSDDYVEINYSGD